VLSLAISATGVDFVTGFSAVAACLNNLGPGLGQVARTYTDLPVAAKWILSLAMLMGRLELFTLIVLMSRTFWRN
jgi:trk system potassium uptake protein TrkH